MHILLTNDDGIHAPGLMALKQTLAPLGKITVFAPSRNYSAAGHRKTLHKPLRVDETVLADGSTGWVCSGAPSDCVALALLGCVKEPVDLVVSGINPNPNLGQDVTYSGTVTAAMEAVIANVPGIAFSTETRGGGDYGPTARIAAQLITQMLERGFPPKIVFNVNVPKGELKGLYITRQGESIYRDELDERHDPRGRPYYWIGGDFPIGVLDEGTDFWALANGYVSVTPLRLDLTAHDVVGQVAAWNLGAG